VKDDNSVHDKDIIRGRRLTNAESYSLSFSEFHVNEEILEEILKPFINEEGIKKYKLKNKVKKEGGKFYD